MVVPSFRRAWAWALLGFAVAQPVRAEAPASFNQAFERIRDRPEFRRSFFGVEVYSLDRKQVLFAWNGDKLFQTGSTAKLLTEATSLELLGGDFRFRTPVYRTGPIEDGVLDGNLVLVASGDPNLSNRLQPDGTLAFADEDHSYGGFDSRLVPGNPAEALSRIAEQIAAAGIRKVDGRILIDVSLFPEGDREMGTGVVRSPVSVNDNVIDLVFSPGAEKGPAVLEVSPEVPYLKFRNEVTTAGRAAGVSFATSEHPLPDGAKEVTIKGQIPSDRGSYVYAMPVESPSRFAAALLAVELKRHGVEVATPVDAAPTSDAFKAAYTPGNKVAELVSAPLSEDVKVTLQTSQNLHASMMPLVWGSVIGKAGPDAERKGFALAQDLLKRTGVDFSGIMQSNGEGAALFSPDFIARFLAWMASRPGFPAFRSALPVLGKSGTLKDILADSPAAGEVAAKTGTMIGPNLLGNSLIVNAKALAGYTTTPSGEKVAVAVYLNNVPIDTSLDDPAAALAAVSKVTGTTVAEVAAAAHLYPVEPAAASRE